MRACAVHRFWDLLESPVTDIASLRRRTSILAALHLVLAVAAVAVLALVMSWAKHLVTLTQRTNVETLVLGFVVVFLAYVLISTLPATWGSLQLVALRLAGTERAQEILQERAARMRREDKHFYVDVAVRGPDGGPVEVALEDERGRVGRIRLDLAEISFVDAPAVLTHSVVQLVLTTVTKLGRISGSTRAPRVVFWDSLNDEAAAAYAAQVSAFDRLRTAVGAEGPIWPQLDLNEAAVVELRRVLRAATPPIRETLLLPDIEYQAEFRVPVIPEPLAFVQLRRRAEHADAVASMGCITLVTLGVLATIAYVILVPPWVPGK